MKWFMAVGLMVMALLLSGCLYPNDQLTKNQVPNEVQLQTIQQAVTQYKEDNQGLVPIKTKPSDTPIFQKYLLDFTALKQGGYISSIPGTAFENGGIYQYVLINPEENPKVKLIDLRISQQVRTVRRQVDLYRDEHLYPPFGEQIADGVYQINYDKMDMDEKPQIQSPYSQKNLSLVMDVNGEVYVDYSPDLYEAIKSYEHSFENGDDIRYILPENTPFVPAYSLPYTIEGEEPVFRPELTTAE
ncbi:hypothetical protein [Sediminibacillus halophilus]|uniref:ABC transporter periplasmic binding protein yphF n=1 Tax=Sediminibacillus halophilus TaxID=482461 RepID=A0A1G9LXT4_9BACI|nr:hypothetical protein [Sediminibacillus halophilus]SDL66235.1 hypothetical protein SAMN05216244_0318 [Sediminibacillus halophilus]